MSAEAVSDASYRRLFATPANVKLAPLSLIEDGKARGFVLEIGDGRFHGFVVRLGEAVFGYVDRCPTRRPASRPDSGRLSDP